MRSLTGCEPHSGIVLISSWTRSWKTEKNGPGEAGKRRLLARQVLTKGEDGGYAWKNADALGSEVMEIKLEAGWNLVAMPGRVAFDESTEALLKNIEIFTFDKKTKVYQPSEGLEPLASYWMRAPEPCTIHFLVIAETP